ncbi:MAG TPA: pitrilysin family protein [Gemmatimonadaceae bacterium]|nr:pitrilysin family protein [Gemmatimonadaceae bacterium]
MSDATGSAATLPEHPRPSPLPPRPYHFPRFERHALANGLSLVVAPVRKLPLVTVRMVADAGAVSEPAGRDGVAHLTVRALLEGTRRLSAVELVERFERLGASVDTDASWDAAALGMTVLADRLGDAFALFGETLRDPAFPEREVHRLREERLAELLHQRAEPRGLADEMFDRFLYHPSSRYALPEDGSESGVSSIDRAAVEAFWRERWRPGGMTLVVAGDIAPDDALALAERTFGDWAPGAPPPAHAIDEPAHAGRAVHLVEKADAPQSELRIGHVGIPRAHPDYFPVLVMNAVLGGLFNSRININLREVHGYTYGASSYFDWRRGAGPFVVSSAVQSDVTDAAAREVLAEIERIRGAEISTDELSLATSWLDGVFPIRYETTQAIAQALAMLVTYDLPADYFDRYRENVRAVQLADVQRAAETHLRPEAVQVVVVGDPAVVREPLARLNAGAVTVYDAEGHPTE